MSHDFLSIYGAKAAEYILAVSYLLLFIPFWRYVQGGKKVEAAIQVDVKKPATQILRAPAARAAGATALRPAQGWFQVPSGVHLHPGHTWARLEADGLVSVGIDDFAAKLVGPGAVDLPALGEKVAQGEPALEIGHDARMVPMLSPVDGTVVAVNASAREKPDNLQDPYGAGWLFKVKAPRLAANFRQLLAENPARRFLEDAGEAIALRMDPQLVHVMQDGGAPIHGIAQTLAGDDWDQLARQHFLT
ncbi:MAG: glycine cleavage system protein H [Anaeromyxobacter sp.]